MLYQRHTENIIIFYVQIPYIRKFYVWKIMRLKIMYNQIFAIINTRKINSTLKYKSQYTINNVKSKHV